MNDQQDRYIETDYSRWYGFSRSSGNNRLGHILKTVLDQKVSKPGFLLERTNDEYILSEDYNPTSLRMNSGGCDEFARYLGTILPEEIGMDRTETEKNVPVPKTVVIPKEEQTDEASRRKRKGFFQRITSANLLIHSLAFVLLSFVVLQALILPGNIGGIKISHWGIYPFFGILIGIWIIDIRSYSRYIRPLKAYGDIFALTALYYALFFLLVFAEAGLIDLFSDSGKFNILWMILLILLGQATGIVISLFLSMIMYFAKGGKAIQYENKQSIIPNDSP